MAASTARKVRIAVSVQSFRLGDGFVHFAVVGSLVRQGRGGGFFDRLRVAVYGILLKDVLPRTTASMAASRALTVSSV